MKGILGRSGAMLFLLLAFNADAAQSGRIDYPYLGIQFTVPAGWQGQEDGESFVMGSMSTSGLLAVFLNESRSPADLRREADKGIVDGSMRLTRSGEFEQFGVEGLGAEFSGYVGGQEAKAYLIGAINPFGKSVTVAALTSTQEYSDRHKQLAAEIVDSLAFAVPKESAVTTDWRQDLKGTRLSYRYSSYSSGSSSYDSSGTAYGSYSSISETTNIDLCSDNSFSYYSSSLASFDSGGGFGGGGSRDSTQGEWQVTTLGNGQTSLTLDFLNGSQQQYDLSVENNKTYLDERRYYRLDSELCR